MKVIYKSISVLFIFIISIFSLLLFYTLVHYVRLDFSTLYNSLKSLTVIVMLAGPTIFSLLLAAYVFKDKLPGFKKYLPLGKLLFQIFVIFYIANFGAFYILKINSKAAVACYNVSDIASSNYCLFLLHPNNTGPYRVLNPNQTMSTISSPNNHQGHPCQKYGTDPGSVLMYDASLDFYGPVSSYWQSIHSAVINFVSGVSIDSSKILVDVPLCSTVIYSAPNSTNQVAVKDAAVATPTPSPLATNSPSPTPSKSPSPAPTKSPSPTPSKSPSPTPTKSPSPSPIAEIQCLPQTVQVINPNQTVSFYVIDTGRPVNNIHWTATGANPSSGIGLTFSTTYANPGNYSVSVSDGGPVTYCSVMVNASSSSTPSPTFTPSPVPKIGDVNGDGFVNIVDIGMVIDNYELVPIPNTRCDLNNDGIANIIDIGIVIDYYGS